MSDTWQTIHQRGQQTNAVWNTHAPAYTVGTLTLALHQADVAALPPAAQALTSQQDVVDAARADRDATCNLIKDLSTRVPRVLDGALEPGDPFHGDLEDIRAVEMTGLDTIITRGQRTRSLWEKVNARNAAAVPVQPPVVVGGKTVADLITALTALPVKTQAVEDARSVLSDKRSDLRTLAARVDKNNKRWYAAWEGNFPVGSPERDALSQIDTGGGPVPVPTVLEIAPPLSVVNATTAQINYSAGGGQHATTLVLQWHVVGQPEWANSAPVELPSQLVSAPEFEQATVRFRTVVSNSAGEAISPVQEVNF